MCDDGGSGGGDDGTDLGDLGEAMLDVVEELPGGGWSVLAILLVLALVLVLIYAS